MAGTAPHDLVPNPTDGRLAGYRYLPAVKADLLRRLGRTADAGRAYLRALDMAGNEAEREFSAGRPGEVPDS